MGKSLIGSRTFWLNVLGLVTAVAGSGIIPPQYSMPALAILNIINRVYFTNEPVTSILPPSTF